MWTKVLRVECYGVGRAKLFLEYKGNFAGSLEPQFLKDNMIRQAPAARAAKPAELAKAAEPVPAEKEGEYELISARQCLQYEQQVRDEVRLSSSRKQHEEQEKGEKGESAAKKGTAPVNPGANVAAASKKDTATGTCAESSIVGAVLAAATDSSEKFSATELEWLTREVRDEVDGKKRWCRVASLWHRPTDGK